MKYLILFFLITCNFCFSQTQFIMNQDADKEFKKADKELNTIYNRILQEYKSDQKFLSKLKVAQKAWIKFRDAEMDALFPEEDKQFQYGSVFPMCWSMSLTKLTKERTKKLKIWTTGIEEGEACNGSIKTKQN